MNYKCLLIFFLFFFNSCTNTTTGFKTQKIINKSAFTNNGFALIYKDKFYKNKTISSKLDDRELIIFQKNLKKGSIVKITNNSNNKSIIAKVGKNALYPLFNNSVITKRIANSIDLNSNEPYVEITEIINSSSFVAKKAKTFDEEKKVATKAPVDEIKIKTLSGTDVKKKKILNKKFNYIIKIADFYFEESAHEMIQKIKKETKINKVNLAKLSTTKFRVFIGPFDNLNSLKAQFNAINILQFENIEIIKK